jgi:quercetin dioxygenase-like cupin family protein
MTVPVSAKFTVIHDTSNIGIYHANKGEGIPRHSHPHSHLTICISGSLVLRKQDLEVIIDKNTQPINLKENECHEIEALEDGTVFVNVFSEGKY